jgi:hypothetical protein
MRQCISSLHDSREERGSELREERLFLCHLLKTAGAALLCRIRARYPDHAVYPLESDGDPIARVTSVENLESAWRTRGEQIKVVTGHHPLCTTELLGGKWVTATVLRHPLARTLSHLKHHREITPQDAHLTLTEVYNDPFRFPFLIHNHMTKMLSLTTDEMTAGALSVVQFTPERLELAKERLVGVDVVGLQEEFEQFWQALANRFGWDPGNYSVRPPAQLPEHEAALHDRILEDNQDDLELYEFAVGLVGQRAARHG